jgi:TadE-like protein
MRRRSKGQSLVEMALMLPLLMLVLFGIIDLGYYIYSYATIYEAARNGSEVAAQLPPFASALGPPAKAGDACVQAISEATEKGAVLFPDISNYVTISYPSGSTRALGKPIQVAINYTVEPLTPLFKFVAFGNKGVMTVNITSRRSIENLGNTPPSEKYPNGIACKP